MNIISPSEIKYIRQACASNFRLDGRSNTHYRPYTLLQPSSSSSSSSSSSCPILSNASSRLVLPASNTDIVCSIKAELVCPPLLSTTTMNSSSSCGSSNTNSGGGGGGGGGVIDLNVDILPYASLSTERRDIKKEEQEVTSILSRLLLPHLFTSQGGAGGGGAGGGGRGENCLVVKEGKYVWRLNIDVLVIHCDGNLVDCCSMAIVGSLKNLKLPRVMAVEHAMENSGGGSTVAGGKRGILDEIMLDSDVANSVKVMESVLDACPIVVTVCLMPVAMDMAMDIMDGESTGSHIRLLRKKKDVVMVVDADRQEEMASSSKVSVSVDRQGNICGIHKYGTSSVLGGGYTTNCGNIKLDMLSKIQSIAASCCQSVFLTVLNRRNGASSSAGKQRNDVTAAAAAAALLWNAEDEYTNFFKSQFELQ